MESLKLNVELRNKGESTKELKKDRILSGVVYGKKIEVFSIKMNYSDFLRVFRKSGTSNIIKLTLGTKEIEVLVQDIQKNPISGDFIHIDFYAITRGEKLITKIPIKFVGESQCVKEGGILEEHLKDIEIKCLPKDLVDAFEVDLSKLKNFGDGLKVSNIDIDLSKFTLLTGEEELVAIVSAPKKVEENDEEIDSSNDETENNEEGTGEE